MFTGRREIGVERGEDGVPSTRKRTTSVRPVTTRKEKRKEKVKKK